MNLAHFSNFCTQKFHLLTMAATVPETRKKPQIPIGTLFLFVVVGLVLRKKSFHRMDLWARTAPAQAAVGKLAGQGGFRHNAVAGASHHGAGGAAGILASRPM